MKFNRLVDYLVLPSEISVFERDYLKRMNRVALAFFWLHPPVFVLVALMAKTSVWQALLFPAVVLVGPTIAHRTFKNPRSISLVFGVTAMCMGGILVHLGQGPMQIEMHFYFFVLLALEAVFANPLVVVVSAVTAALHHLLLFLLLPASVFNYDASIWAVVVHAIFVVLESVAACFVARSFFDNVIGLEKIVEARTHELDLRNADLRLVLDNVGQGFMTVDRDGKLSSERSRVVETWFGEIPPGATLHDVLARADQNVAAMFQLGLGDLFEDVMPTEVILDQLPRRIAYGGSTWELGYQPIFGGEKISKLLVILSDITSTLERERAEQERRELAEVLERAIRDHDAVVELVSQSQEIVDVILSPSCETDELLRQIHTLKGNSAIFGVASVAGVCHEVESAAIERGAVPNTEERARIASAWSRFRARMDPFLKARSTTLVTITEEEHAQYVQSIVEGAPRADLARNATEWAREPAELRFMRIAEQIAAIARRLGKPQPIVEIDTSGIRLPRGSWSPFWSAFVHAIRNALDHGIEQADERADAGKPEKGTIGLRTTLHERSVEITLEDDGRGVDWGRVRAKAEACGLPAKTEADLVAALFADGFSTKEEATDMSGRGVGMSALRRACAELGGSITIESTSGAGTKVTVRLPREDEAALVRKIVRRAESLRPSHRPLSVQ